MRPAKKKDEQLELLNTVADRLTTAGFVVEEPQTGDDFLDVWSKDTHKGFIEIYLCGFGSVFHTTGGMFTWSISDKDFDIEFTAEDTRDLEHALIETFKD